MRFLNARSRFNSWWGHHLGGEIKYDFSLDHFIFRRPFGNLLGCRIEIYGWIHETSSFHFYFGHIGGKHVFIIEGRANSPHRDGLCGLGRNWSCGGCCFGSLSFQRARQSVSNFLSCFDGHCSCRPEGHIPGFLSERSPCLLAGPARSKDGFSEIDHWSLAHELIRSNDGFSSR